MTGSTGSTSGFRVIEARDGRKGMVTYLLITGLLFQGIGV